MRWALSAPVVVALCLAVGVTTAACSGPTPQPQPTTNAAPPDSTAGPLAVGGDAGEVCAPLTDSTSPQRDYTFGFHTLPNRGQQRVEVTTVSLVNPRHVTLADALLVPVNGNLVGLASSWPPPSEQTAPTTGVRWDQRMSATAATIDPNTGDQLNLVLHLRVDGPGGLDAVRVGYTAGGQSYTGQTNTKVTFRDSCG